MENPIITVGSESFLTVSQHTRHVVLHMETDMNAVRHRVCRFLENNTDLYAAVLAPVEDTPQFARRIVSFLGAYMRIGNVDLLETDILRCIQRNTRSPSNIANNTV